MTWECFSEDVTFELRLGQRAGSSHVEAGWAVEVGERQAEGIAQACNGLQASSWARGRDCRKASVTISGTGRGQQQEKEPEK